MNDFLTNRVILTDTGVAAGNVNLYSQNGRLYYNDQAIAPLTGITGNANEIIMVKIPLTSGITDQQIVFPQSYNVVPHVNYAIIGQNQSNILGHQITDLSTGYVQISFTKPIPNDQFTLQLFAWKSTNYLTLTGTAYEINAIHQAGAIRVDSVYGSVGGIRNRPDVPFQTLAQGVAAASPGDVVYFGSGNYLGQTISTNNLTFVFEEGASITTPLTLGSNITGTFYNLQLDISDTNQASALTVNSNARAIFRDGNYISMPVGGVTSRSSVAGAGTIECLGSLYHSHYINPSVTVTERNPEFFNQGIHFISPFGAAYTGGSGLNGLYTFSTIDNGIAFASANQKLFVKSGIYAGFTLTKNLTVEFEDGVVITSPIFLSANVTGTFRNLNQLITSIDATTGIGISLGSNSFLNLDGQNKINYPNTSNQSFAAISGAGKVFCRGNIFYGVGIASNLDFNGEKVKVFVTNNVGNSVPSGHNNVVKFISSQQAVDFISSNSVVTFDSGNWTGFNYSKSNCTFNFNDFSKITSPITLNGNAVFHNLVLDVANTGSNYGVVINAGNTGTFKSSVAKVPQIQSPYLIDFSGNSIYKITGVFTSSFTITSSGSGYYISGNNTLVTSGFSGSGITTFPAYSISGNGSTIIYQLVSNCDTYSSITNNMLGVTLNSGVFFAPTPIYFVQ